MADSSSDHSTWDKLFFFPAMAGAWTSYNPCTPRSTIGFFYPPPSPIHVLPLSPDDTHAPSSSSQAAPDSKPPPVPPFPAAFNLPATYNPHLINSNEKLHHAILPPPSPTRVPNIQQSWRIRFIFLTLTPLPPLLAALYTLLGAAILSLPIALAASGAVGGAIISIPLLVVVFFLLSPWAPPPPPEDFFDDASSTASRRYLKVEYLVCSMLATFVGTISAPLGAACIKQDARDATKAGTLGGVIFLIFVLALGALGLLTWLMHTRRRHQEQE